MQQGRAAMAVYFSPYWGQLVGGDSLFAEEMGWIIVPHAEGVTPGRSQNAGWVLAINADSENKEAAWDLIEYLTTKEAQVRAASEFANGPVRLSTYDNEAYLEAFPLATDWATAIAASIFEPPHDLYPQMQDIMSEEIILALDGEKTSEEAMNATCERIDQLLD
jgi:multiple sugar transport system substrate-binding protein